MPPKNGEGGRSTANSRRSLFAKELDPNPPSGGAVSDIGNKDVQDALFQPIPPSGGEVAETVLSKEPGQDSDLSVESHADVQLVRGGSADVQHPLTLKDVPPAEDLIKGPLHPWDQRPAAKQKQQYFRFFRNQ